jgi:hypothetical protein
MLVPLLAMLFALSAQQAPTPTPTPDPAVVSRGDHAMGFSHDTTTHHFLLNKSGGAIEAIANDPADVKSRDQIRMHLSHIQKKFAAGDFDVPMFIHDTTLPGVPTMSRLRDQIHYKFEETPQGAIIRITTTNTEALTAVHDFLRFQISDHKTGDSRDVR